MGNQHLRRPIPIASLDRKQKLSQAGRAWIEFRRPRSAKATTAAQELYLRTLIRFFGDIPLNKFDITKINDYQDKRVAGASCINHELTFLSRLLRNADLWAPIERHYMKLQEEDTGAPKTYTREEQEAIFKALRDKPKLAMARIVFTITRNTTASGSELRALQLKHVELNSDPPRVHIPRAGTKNMIRPRVIPLNSDAQAAFREAMERANRLGSVEPDHYLFPFWVGGRPPFQAYDPTRPPNKSWMRKQVLQLRKATGIAHIRPHGFRHLAVTELLERGAPEQTVIAIAGWASRKMIETYSHTRMESKAEALALLTGKTDVERPAAPHPGPRRSSRCRQYQSTRPIRPGTRRRRS